MNSEPSSPEAPAGIGVEDKGSKEGPKIKFPEDIGTVRALQNKLAQYEGELGFSLKESPGKPPELVKDKRRDYKIAVLERLLTTGEVDEDKLAKELKEKHGSLDVPSFYGACSAVQDFVKFGIEGSKGGLGPELQRRQETRPKSRIGGEIEFPEDIGLVRALQNKFVEYQERLGSQMKENSPSAKDTQYKIAVLKRLLTTGKVNKSDMFRDELGKDLHNFDKKLFNNALGIIESYATTGGAGVTGGTGLKFEQK